MVWDFAEASPFGWSSGDDVRKLGETGAALDQTSGRRTAVAMRTGIGDEPPLLDDESQDAVITDPPYYDNISYADLSDFFYVWLKRSVGFLYPDDLGGQLTPKRNEAVVSPYRHHGSKDEGARVLRADDGRVRSRRRIGSSSQVRRSCVSTPTRPHSAGPRWSRLFVPPDSRSPKRGHWTPRCQNDQ